MTRPRRILLGVVSLLLVAGTVAHGWYWYAPRWHALAVERARLLPPTPAARAALWIPYPHQNLAALEDAVAAPEAVVAAAGRLLGAERAAIPRLRPFGVPAAREVTIEWRDAEDPAIRAAVYPLWRWVAKAAGGLAGNPWLAGGPVDGGSSPRTVRWVEGIWELGGEAVVARGREPADRSRRAVWARFEERRPGRALPPGTYDVTVFAGGLCLAPAGRELEAPPPPEDVVLLVVDRREGSTRALVVAGGGPVRIGEATIPGLGAVAATEREALEILPAGRWLEEILELPTATREGGAAVATDEATLALTEDALDAWTAWMEREGLEAAAWLRPAPGARLAGSVAELLEELPLVGRRTRERWRDAATVLEAASGLRVVLAAG